jgi:hypothetical protein
MLFLQHAFTGFWLPIAKGDFDSPGSLMYTASCSDHGGEMLEKSDMAVQRPLERIKTSNSLGIRADIRTSNKSCGVERKTQGTDLKLHVDILRVIFHHIVLVAAMFIFC